MASIDEAAVLIHQLNDPRFANNANQISQRILDIQLSPDGWAVADKLISSEVPTFQFYGALTYQVCLNRDGKSLSPDHSKAILERLLIAFKDLVSGYSQNNFVVDKVCSTLSTFQIQAPLPWKHALDCAIMTIESDTIILEGRLEGHAVVETSISKLSAAQILALLRLVKIMAEDLDKLDAARPESHQVLKSFETNASTFSQLLMYLLKEGREIPQQLFEETLATWLAWVNYAASHLNYQLDLWTQLQSTSNYVIACLGASQIPRIHATCEALTTVLAQNKSFLTESQHEVLRSALDLAKQSCQYQEGDHDLPLLRLTSAWGRANMDRVLGETGQPAARGLFVQMTDAFFGADWADDDSDRLYTVLDFWDQFAESLVELTDFNPEFIASADSQHRVLEIVEPFSQAAFDVLDPKEEGATSDVDEDLLEDYKRLHRNFAEILRQLVSLPFIPVYNIITGQYEEALAQENWPRIESVLQILVTMELDYEPSQGNEHAMARVFGSDLFRNLSSEKWRPRLTPRLRRRLVSFVDSYGFIIKQDQKLIQTTLTFLMDTLEQSSTSSPRLADLAAKCMASICHACRAQLVGQIDELMSFCGRTLAEPSLSSYQKEKIYGSIASVIVALPRDELTLAPMKVVVDQLHADINAGSVLIAQGDKRGGEAAIVTALQCLGAVGKALHGRTTTIVIDDDETPREKPRGSVWLSADGQSVSAQILACIHSIEALTSNGDAWDAVCAILRGGLAETEPGPFTFAPSLISGFLQNMTLLHPRVETMLTTACTFVSAHSRSNAPRIEADVMPLTRAVANVMIGVGSNPGDDPGLVQLATDYMERLLPRYPDVLLGQEPAHLQAVLELGLASFTSNLAMLKRATASFLSALLQLPAALHAGTPPHPRVDGLPEHAAAVVADFLPHVAAAIAHQVGGHAQRSELEAVGRVLRSLVQAAGPRARALLEASLAGPAFPSDARVDETQKRVFVSRIVLLRGGRGTAEAVKEFWAAARGTVSTFT